MSNSPDRVRPRRAFASGIGRRALLAALTAACLPLAAACATGGAAASNLAAPDAANASGNGNMDIALPQSIVDLPLVDPAGHPMSLSSLKGKVIVVSDVMTLCQETCPLDTANIVQAARAVEKAGLGDRVEDRKSVV